MEIYDEYTGQVYQVPPEEEYMVLQLQARNATIPEIVDALLLPTPDAGEPEVHGFLPSADGTVIPVSEVEELNEEQ